MTLAPFATHLDKLKDLRDRIDKEIRDEEERQARITKARKATFRAQTTAARRQMRSAARQQALDERAALLATAPAATVRAWARENGIEVGIRGKVRVEVYEAYGQAMAEREQPVDE